MPLDTHAISTALVNVGDFELSTGNKMVTAASELQVVANALNEDEAVDNGLERIEAGTRSTRNLLSPVAAILHTIATGLINLRIEIPELQTRRLDLGPAGSFNVVSGFRLVNQYPLRPIGNNVESMADDLDSVGAALLEIANATRLVQEQIPTIRTRIRGSSNNLREGGEKLISSGTAMKDVAQLFAQ